MALVLPKNRVAIVPFFDPDTTASGRLYIPDTAKGRSDQGIIKYVGEVDKEHSEWERFSPGDYVLFSGWTGTLIEISGEGRLIIMPINLIVAKVPTPDSNITEISGVYFKGTDGEYWPATYEMTMELCRDSLSNTKWYREFNAHKEKKGWIPEKPKVEDYSQRTF